MSERVSAKKKQRKSRIKKRNLTICTTYCHYDVVREAATLLGLREVAESEPWNIFWTNMSVSMERVKAMKRFQKINHFPGMIEICRKDLLARNLGRMKKLFPEEYKFFPKTWILPADYGEMYESNRRKKTKVFILKPFVSSQGRGIFICKGLNNLHLYEHMICQLYIKKPLLVDGFKFDLRIYVLVTSCDPLRIFVYNEGLMRLATKKYSKPSSDNISNVYMHLTNYAVNRYSRAYLEDDECGSKRKISTLKNWLNDHNYDTENLWNKIDDIIIKTFLCAYSTLKHNYSTCFSSHFPHQACFELLGFDILLDHKLKPYLLEVNHSPSFSTKTKVDQDVKRQLLLDTFSILNLGMLNNWKIMQEDKQRCEARLLQGLSKKQEKNLCKPKMESIIKDQEIWEEEHIGNFRLIYPSENTSKYDSYINDNISSTIQTTIASRFREEAVRQNSLRTQEKARLEAEKRMNFKTKDTARTKMVENEDLNSKVNTMRKTAKETKNGKEAPTELKIEKPREDKYIPNSFEPQSLESESEEQQRIRELQFRDFVIRGSGLVQDLYFSQKRNRLLSLSDYLKYSSLEK